MICKKIFMLVVLFSAVFAEAGLWNPAILNPSFEDPLLDAGAQSNDINDWWDALSYTYTQNDNMDGYPDTPYGDNWGELGNNRWIYQQIGTYEENMYIDISFLAGQKSDSPFTTAYVTLLVGGDPALAADINLKFDTENPLETRVGATQIARSDAIAPFETADTGTSEQIVSFSTGTGYTVGAPLWVQINKEATTGRALIDNIVVAYASDDPSVTNSTPGVNATAVDPLGVMSWDAVNETYPNFDINIGTTTACDDILTAQTTGANTNFTPAQGLLGYMTTYYWRVDVTDSGTEYQGPVWLFTTGGKAFNPVPADGARLDRDSAQINWTGDNFVSSYDIYFGFTGNLKFVGNYSQTSVPVADLLTAMSKDILPDGYYQWKVNTLNTSGQLIVEGDIWNLTVPEIEPVYIDDFTGYNDTAQLLAAWIDGSTNSSGSSIELNDLYGSMACAYDNTISPFISQVDLQFTPGANWIIGGHSALSISFFGQTGNSIEDIYVVVESSTESAKLTFNGFNSTQTNQWWEWQIPLDSISDQGVDLENVLKLKIGFENTSGAGGKGNVNIDDIMLIAPNTCPNINDGDFNDDCVVDFADLLIISDQWLFADFLVSAVDPTDQYLQAYYAFEERAGIVVYDLSGNGNNADIGTNGVSDFWETIGYTSDSSIRVKGDLKLLVPNTVFTGIGNTVTISMWVKATTSPLEQFELSSGNIPRVDNYWSFAKWTPDSAVQQPDQWGHFAGVIDTATQQMDIYFNGVLSGRTVSSDVLFVGNAAGTSTLELDCGNDEVLIDDLRIYSNALTQNQIVYLAAGNGGIISQSIGPIFTPADTNEDGRIDFKDMAIIALGWIAQ